MKTSTSTVKQSKGNKISR